MDHFYGQMEGVIEVNGIMENNMVMDIINLKMEKKKKVFGYKEKMSNGFLEK